MKKRSRKIHTEMVVLILLSVLFAAWVIVLLDSLYIKDQRSIRHYLRNSTPMCRIPDIDDGFVPQGLVYNAASDSILLAGFAPFGEDSPIYVVERETGAARKLFVRLPNGQNFRGHAGGLSIYDDVLYIAGSTAGCMYGLPLSEVLEAASGDVIDVSVVTNLKDDEDRIRVSFTASDYSFLYAGEFHFDPIFFTLPSHYVDTEYGGQGAYLLGFVPDEEGEMTPACVYSIPDKIQGACFDRGYLYLSQSDSLLSSRILTYRLGAVPVSGTRKVFGKEVPLYILTEHGADKSTRIAPMAEEIYVVQDNLYILYESAADSYRIGKQMGMDYVQATPVMYFR